MSKKRNNSDEVEMVILRTTNNNHELNIIKAMLEEHGIPYLVKDRGIGGYMRIISGSSPYGTDVLVDILDIKKAEIILNEFPCSD